MAKAKKKSAKKAAKKKAAKKVAKKAAKKAAKKVAKKVAKKKTSAASGKTIDAYTAKFPDWRGVVLERIRELVASVAPTANASIKWAQPVFEQGGPFAFMRAHTRHVTLGFWRGKELADPKHRLESGGQRMAHVKIGSVDDVDESQFTDWVRQAVALNTKKGDPTKRG